MTQIFISPNSSIDSQKLYCYTNNSEKIVITQINGLVKRHCERNDIVKELFFLEKGFYLKQMIIANWKLLSKQT